MSVSLTLAFYVGWDGDAYTGNVLMSASTTSNPNNSVDRRPVISLWKTSNIFSKWPPLMIWSGARGIMAVSSRARAGTLPLIS